MMNRGYKWSALVGGLLAGTCAPVVGQEGDARTRAAAEQTTASSAGIYEVVVTAQRRTERLLDVPVSVVATSGEALQALNLNAATDLIFTTPGLALGDSNTSRGAGFRVRGIGTNVFADGIEQSVGTVVDGVPLARAGQGLADLIDIERVEVLRGPQGLLFGRNASAGLINIVTRRPTDRLSLFTNASYGSDNEIKAASSLAGPLGDSVKARASGYYNTHDGFVRHVTTGQDLNDRHEYGFRGTLEFDPSETIEVLIRGDWSKRDNVANVWTVRQFATPATDPRPGTLFLSSFTGPIAQGPEARENNAGGRYSNEVESQGASGEINWRLGDYTLTSLSAYRTWDELDHNDADLSPANVLDRNTGSNDLRQLSQELRLTSPSDQTVEFVAGLFYFDVSNENFSSQVGRVALSLARLQQLGVDAPLVPGLVLPANQLFGRDLQTDVDVTDYAAFGQATIHVTDALSLIAGGRYTRTDVALDYARVGTPGANAFNFLVGGGFAPLAFEAETKDSNFSWRLGAQLELAADHNLYASVARGYKGPGYNNLPDVTVPAGQTPQAFTQVAAEIPTAYELGYKAALFDRRLTLSAALYQSDFKDFQAQVFEQPAGSPIGTFAIRNAGKLQTRGFELEIAAQPTDRLTLGVGFALNDAEFKSFNNASCPAQGALITTVGAPCGPLVAGGPNARSFDASGLGATNAPKYTGTANARYEAPFGEVLTGFAQANYYWRSDTTYGLYPDNIPNPTVQESYGVLNGAIGVSTSDDRWTISVFARNLLDKNYVNSIFALPFDAVGGLGQFVTHDAERTVGVQVNVRL